MSRGNDINVTAQGELKMGGRGFDRIEHVVHYQGRNKYALQIDTKHGKRGVMDFDPDENTIGVRGDSRTSSFLQIELSNNGAKKLKQQIESEFDIERKEL